MSDQSGSEYDDESPNNDSVSTKLEKILIVPFHSVHYD